MDAQAAEGNVWRWLLSLMRRAAWALPICLFLLTSCTASPGRIGASVTSDEQTATIEIARCPDELIQQIQLMAHPADNLANTQVVVWQIDSAGEPTDSVVVGSTPAGYREVVRLLRTLGRSEELTAVVVAKGGRSSGLQSFQIDHLSPQRVYVGREFTDETAWRESSASGGACLGGSFLSGAWWMIFGFWGLILAIAAIVWLPRLLVGRQPPAGIPPAP